MRHIKNILLAGCFLAMLSSCKKDNQKPQSIISYKVDGVLKTFKPDASFYTYDNSLFIGGGEPGGGEEISLVIDSNARIGDFNLERGQDNAVGFYEPGGFVSDSGKVVITSFDRDRITGSFEFTARHNGTMVNITEGRFIATVINFTKYIQPPDGDPSVGGGNVPGN